MKIKFQMTLALFFLASLIISACSPAAPATPAEPAANTEAASQPEAASATETPAATEPAAPANLAIAPETLGQISLLWNADFPGDPDADTGCEPRQQPCTRSSGIFGYAFSSDGNMLAVAVCLGIASVDQSKDDGNFYSCSGESAIILYDSATGEERGRLAPAALPLSLAFHPDGTTLAAGLANSDIELWDLTTSEISNTLSGNPRFVGINRLDFTPDGNLLISGYVFTFQLSVWDWRSSEPPALIDRAFGFDISPDSRNLVTINYGTQVGDNADAIRIYDLAQLDQFSEIPLDGQLAPSYLSFNPQNGWISGAEVAFPVITNFWDSVSQSLVGSLGFDQEFDANGMLYDLNAGGFTPDGYFLLMRYGQLLTADAQPDATGLSEPQMQCGFALADVETNQVFYSPERMLYDDCIGPEHMYIMLGSETLILSPDGRFIAGDDLSTLRVWGIDASLSAVVPATGIVRIEHSLR